VFSVFDVTRLSSAIEDELWLFLIPAGLAVILLAVFLEEVGFFLRHAASSRRKHLYLWILGMYPVTLASSFTHMAPPLMGAELSPNLGDIDQCLMLSSS